jgi:hypothetical protein
LDTGEARLPPISSGNVVIALTIITPSRINPIIIPVVSVMAIVPMINRHSIPRSGNRSDRAIRARNPISPATNAITAHQATTPKGGMNKDAPRLGTRRHRNVRNAGNLVPNTVLNIVLNIVLTIVLKIVPTIGLIVAI